MRNTEPYVELIAKTEVLKVPVAGWLRKLGVIGSWLAALLDDNKTSAERLVELAGRRCYMSFQPNTLNPNVTKIRTNITEYIDNVLKSGHGSVLEHVYFTFAIENVSRVFTGEMNRHRAGMSISEGSMRYIRYTDIPYWIPNCFRGDATHFDKTLNYMSKEEATRASMARVFSYVEREYKYLIEKVWAEELSPESKFSKKKELTSGLRRIIPMGVSTGGVWSGNLRALRHIFEMRCTPHAEEEIMLVATMMLNIMKDAEPTFFGDFSTDEFGFSKPKYHKV